MNVVKTPMVALKLASILVVATPVLVTLAIAWLVMDKAVLTSTNVLKIQTGVTKHV
jgi:hypothetical protein